MYAPNSGKNLDFPNLSWQNSLRNEAASDVFPHSPKGLEGVRPVPIVTASSEIVEYPLYDNPTTRSWKFSQKGHTPSTAQRGF